MARVPSKHGRDQALDFQGFLNDLQDWELSLKDRDKKLKPQPSQSDKVVSSSSSGKIGIVGEDRGSGKSPTADYSRSYDEMSRISSSFIDGESFPDAASEKELGNEYFKQKKFNEAIDCYSRSIALSPTAVAFANRAMAHIKIRRFHEAEDDCTEALNLDDRYIKAYSRRATARKELGKLKESMEDSEFSLRLEPNNQEIKKQYSEAKSLYEKEVLQKATGVLKKSVQGMQRVGKSEAKVNGQCVASSNTSRTVVDSIQEDQAKDNDMQVPKTSAIVEEIKSTSMGDERRTREQKVDGSPKDATWNTGLGRVQSNQRTGKQELKESIKELASRAASRAMVEAAQKIRPPNSAYQFEVSWQGFSGDLVLQARLLKVTSPAALPHIFKNALSAPVLVDIIKCVATFFTEDMDLAVKYLENLTKVSRFDILIMCLPSADRADLLNIWDEVFCNEATPTEYAEMLDSLRPRYCLKR